jgi:hypothetical protein
MWVKTINGNLINLDRIVNITVRQNSHVNDYTHSLSAIASTDQYGADIRYILFNGTEEECLAALFAIENSLDLPRPLGFMRLDDGVLHSTPRPTEATVTHGQGRPPRNDEEDIPF